MSNFYEFTQNNSGGGFDVDDKICHRLYIEAENFDQAKEKAVSFGVYFDGCDTGQDCPCCGDRWSDYESKVNLPYEAGNWRSGEKTTLNTVEEVAQHNADNWGWTIPDARIFYKDGSVKEIFKAGTEPDNG